MTIKVKLKGTGKPKPANYVDVTPSWEVMAHMMSLLITEGATAEARQTGRDELIRMARLADLYVASQEGETS